jgi:hypothetical protein
MRAIGLVFLTLGYAASAVAAAGTSPSVAASQQAPARSAADTADNHSREADRAAPAGDRTQIGKTPEDPPKHPKAADNKIPAANASRSKTNHRNEVANRRERSASADSKNSHRPASDKSAGAAPNGLAPNEAAKRAPSDRAPSAVKGAVPSLGNVRHRGRNPAIVGGAGNSNSRNSAGLDGTHMNRRRVGN